MKRYFYPADIYLPDFDRVDGNKWAVVACDQFTAQKDYWQAVEEWVGDAPSALRLTLRRSSARPHPRSSP